MTRHLTPSLTQAKERCIMSAIFRSFAQHWRANHCLQLWRFGAGRRVCIDTPAVLGQADRFTYDASCYARSLSCIFDLCYSRRWNSITLLVWAGLS